MNILRDFKFKSNFKKRSNEGEYNILEVKKNYNKNCANVTNKVTFTVVS